MRYDHRRKPRRSRYVTRWGTTLTEVLMALLVMGLGIVSVATLFPLSVLRAVEATKLTHATMLRQNAEAMIKSRVSVNLTATPIAVIARAIVEDPDFDGDIVEHDGTKFVYDPLGWAIFNQDDPTGGTIGSMNFFGDFDANGRFDGNSGTGTVSRFAFDLPSVFFDAGGNRVPAGDTNISLPRTRAERVKLAESLYMLPDSFVSIADLLSTAFVGDPAVGSTLTPNTKLLDEFAGTTVRLTFLHVDGKGSEVRFGTVSSGSPASVTFSPTLPSSYSGNVGRVIVEIPERRYTWLATVRRYGPKPSVTVVVFFRRSFSPLDEKVYSVSEPVGTYNQFTMSSVDAEDAGVKVGSFLFDTALFRWHKVVDIDRPAGLPVTITTDANEFDPSDKPRTFSAMFPKNVVEAYTLRKD